MKLSDKDYFAAEGVSQSALKTLLRSPAYMGQEFEPNEAMQLGTAVHALAMEHKTVYKIAPDVNKRTKDGRAEFAAFEAECAANDLFAFTQQQAAKVEAMVKALREHPTASIITKNPEHAEIALFGECPYTGLKIKGKVDYLPDTGSVAFDLKTSRDASPAAFQRSIRYDYWIQVCHYMELINQNGFNKSQFLFVAVDNSAPFAVGCYVCTEEWIERYQMRYIEAMSAYANWHEGGKKSEAHTETFIEVD